MEFLVFCAKTLIMIGDDDGTDQSLMKERSSRISNLETQSDQDDHRHMFVAIVFCLLFMGLLLFILFFMYTVEGDNVDPDSPPSAVNAGGGGEGGGGGGGGGGASQPKKDNDGATPVITVVHRTLSGHPGGGTPIGPSPAAPIPTMPGDGPLTGSRGPPAPPPDLPVTAMATTTTTSTTTTTTTTTTKRPIELTVHCTVGRSAVMASMYPDDGICHYIYYSDVEVVDNELQAIEVETSWAQFKERAKTYTVTGVGAAFDIRYVTVHKVQDPLFVDHLNKLAQQNNIKHYGILNLVARVGNLRPLLDTAKGVITQLRNVQANDPARKTILALGLYDYEEAQAWNIYKDLFTTAVNDGFADIVIAISSTGWLESEDPCIVVPPSVLAHPNSAGFPTIERFSELVKEGSAYTGRNTTLGLSLEFGVLLYTLAMNASGPVTGVPYSRCLHAGITSLDSACTQTAAIETVPQSKVQISFLPGSLRDVITFDNQESVWDKVSYVESLRPRRPYAWLLFDVHLDDFSGDCKLTPFSRITFFKTKFNLA